MGVLLTQNDMFIIGDITRFLGFIFNSIFNLMNFIGLQNIGLCIIIFTFFTNMILIPITVKQQKFSKLSAKMNPEIMAIRNKYKGKTDQASMLKMNDETKSIYSKYGTSPTGGCLYMFIQFPIIIALYQVVYNIPAYVTIVKDAYMPLVNQVMASDGFQKIMETIGKAKGISPDKLSYEKVDTIVDVFNKFNTADWGKLAEKFPDLENVIEQTAANIGNMNSFFGGLNISDAPISNLLSIAILIPILAGVTQWLSVRLMPTPDTGMGDSQMGNSMKMVNNFMPIMSAVFCFSFPIGVGLYWIAGSAFRTIQQLLINRHMDKVDIEDMIKHNIDKANKKREKKGLPPQKVITTAKTSVRNIEKQRPALTEEQKKEQIKRSTEYYSNESYKEGSLAAKANMVKKFNEKSNKK